MAKKKHKYREPTATKQKRQILRGTFRNCPNCGKPGPHFIPPSFDVKGQFMCEEIK